VKIGLYKGTTWRGASRVHRRTLSETRRFTLILGATNAAGGEVFKLWGGGKRKPGFYQDFFGGSYFNQQKKGGEVHGPEKRIKI